LRKLATAILFALFLTVGIGTDPAPAQDGVVTFKFTNLARNTIFMKMFSEDRRGYQWPGPNRHYILDDRLQRDARLSCLVGEKICYGGGYNTSDSSRFWGVGYRGNKGCEGCCLICGTYGQEVFSAWDLVD
jgi:hypothetical protein